MSDPSTWILPRGFEASAVKAGIKPSGSLDLALLVNREGCSAAGTFTTNRVAAAPVVWCRELLPADLVRAVVVNAGNANAATGEQGAANARRTAECAAELLHCRPEEVLVASTGVIGHQLPMEKLEAGLAQAVEQLSAEAESFDSASRAIMTTDTKPKIVTAELQLIGGQTVHLFGIAKGAAMIGPRMATMLAFLMTDARIMPGALQGLLSSAVDVSFNRLSVEGHTSTNDTVLLLSGGKDTAPLRGQDLVNFSRLVKECCIDLARKIADDGEGATHLITIDVSGCTSEDEALTIARCVADSPLVKTAIHGADPNWGRIVSAAGYSGVEFDPDDLALVLNGTPLFRDGQPLPFDAAAVASSIRSNRETHIELSLKRGEAAVRFWTSDLTAEYVRLNADYTT